MNDPKLPELPEPEPTEHNQLQCQYCSHYGYALNFLTGCPRCGSQMIDLPNRPARRHEVPQP